MKATLQSIIKDEKILRSRQSDAAHIASSSETPTRHRSVERKPNEFYLTDEEIQNVWSKIKSANPSGFNTVQSAFVGNQQTRSLSPIHDKSSAELDESISEEPAVNPADSLDRNPIDFSSKSRSVQTRIPNGSDLTQEQVQAIYALNASSRPGKKTLRAKNRVSVTRRF